MNSLENNIFSTQIGIKIELLNINKEKDDATKEACLVGHNPIYYDLRTTHSLREWKCYKHNNK